MENLTTTAVLQTLFTSMFMGFGALIPLFHLIKTGNLKGIAFKELFILQGIQGIRLAGILNLILQLPLMYNLYALQQPQANGVNVSIQGGNLENYGWVIFYGPVLYFILTQLLWIKKLHTHRILLIVIALLILILPSQPVLDLWVSLTHTHYIAANRIGQLGNLAIQLAISVVIFFFVTFMLMQLTGKMKKVAGTSN